MKINDIWHNLINKYWFNFVVILGIIDIYFVSLFFIDVNWAEFYIFAFHLIAPLYLFIKLSLISIVVVIDKKLIKKTITTNFIVNNKLYSMLAIISLFVQIAIIIIILIGMFFYIKSWGIDGTIENYKSVFIN